MKTCCYGGDIHFYYELQKVGLYRDVIINGWYLVEGKLISLSFNTYVDILIVERPFSKRALFKEIPQPEV